MAVMTEARATDVEQEGHTSHWAGMEGGVVLTSVVVVVEGNPASIKVYMCILQQNVLAGSLFMYYCIVRVFRKSFITSGSAMQPKFSSENNFIMRYCTKGTVLIFSLFKV